MEAVYLNGYRTLLYIGKSMTHTQATEHKIQVMNSFLKHGIVKTRVKSKGVSEEINPWYETLGPTWDWYRNDYKEKD